MSPSISVYVIEVGKKKKEKMNECMKVERIRKKVSNVRKEKSKNEKEKAFIRGNNETH